MKTVTRYPLSISLLHWLLAAALIGNLIVGLLLDDNEDLVSLHKSIGVAILVLVAIRIVNRLRVRRRLPPSVNPTGTMNHFAERGVHGLLICADGRHSRAWMDEAECGRAHGQLLRALLAADPGAHEPRTVALAGGIARAHGLRAGRAGGFARAGRGGAQAVQIRECASAHSAFARAWRSAEGSVR